MLRLAQLAVISAVCWFVLDYCAQPVSGLAAGVVGFAAAYLLTKLGFALRYGIKLGAPEPEHHNQRYWYVRYPPRYFR